MDAKLLKANRRAVRKARRQAKTPSQRISAGANKLLRKSGYFPKRGKTEDEYVPLEAEQIGSNGGLKPIWHGRAS